MERSLALVRISCQFLTTDQAKFVTRTLVISLIDHCLNIWATAKNKDLNKLQLMQNKASCVVLIKCSFRTSVNTMHSNLDWLKFSDRTTASLIFSTWKMLHQKTPHLLNSQFNNNLESHGYSTRQASEGRSLLPQ